MRASLRTLIGLAGIIAIVPACTVGVWYLGQVVSPFLNGPGDWHKWQPGDGIMGLWVCGLVGLGACGAVCGITAVGPAQADRAAESGFQVREVATMALWKKKGVVTSATENRQAIPPVQTSGYLQSAMATATSSRALSELDTLMDWEPAMYDAFRAQPVMVARSGLSGGPLPTRTPETLPLSDLLKTLTKGGPDRIRKFLDL